MRCFLRGGRSETGETLIEVLVAVVIMGIGFVALLGTMAISVKASSLHRTQAVAELEVRRYAELVDSAAWDQNSNYSTPSGVPTTPAKAAPYNLVSVAPTVIACSPSCGASAQTQTVQVEVGSADGKVQESVQIVKRAP